MYSNLALTRFALLYLTTKTNLEIGKLLKVVLWVEITICLPCKETNNIVEIIIIKENGKRYN